MGRFLHVAGTRPSMDSRRSPGNPIADGQTATAAKSAVLLIILFFVAFWTLQSSLSSNNLDAHGDMVENFAWGIGWQLGYYKHPPFFAWASAAWFLVFPRTNVFYHLLSMTSVAVAMWAMWRISTRLFDRNQQNSAGGLGFLPAAAHLPGAELQRNLGDAAVVGADVSLLSPAD